MKTILTKSRQEVFRVGEPFVLDIHGSPVTYQRVLVRKNAMSTRTPPKRTMGLSAFERERLNETATFTRWQLKRHEIVVRADNLQDIKEKALAG